jgi:YidC/Oxa1 family membrane protein insertase
VNGPLTWFALKSKYFLAAAFNDSSGPPFGGVIATPAGDHRASLAATLLPRDGEFHYRLYLGPQEPDRLSALGLQDVSVFGWKFLQPILRPLGHAITWALLQMHRALGLGYGWVLILFGFLIRFVLWPLNATAMRSQIKNMEMQPRIKEIQARFKSDPEKLQKEMLRLYKEEGFNPMGGCLPMFLPFPVLIALFFVFQSTIEFRGVSFLWLPDLSRADPLFILPVALGISMFIQQFLNMRAMKDQPAQMKYMTYIMPVFMTLLFLRFASGLNLYYASMNIASVPQQLQIMREKKKRLGGKR